MNKNEIFEALTEVSHALGRSSVKGRINVVGGVALILMGFERASTTDVDAVLLPERAVVAASEAAGALLRLPTGWLNSQAQQFIPEGYGEPVIWSLALEFENLEVYVPQPEVLLFMKLRACRGKDVDDIRQLTSHLRITTIDECEEIINKYRPGEDLSSKAVRMLDAILEQSSQSSNHEFFKPPFPYPPRPNIPETPSGPSLGM
ncbi:DUF6036 family nucleotidyltransferase [Aurantimicrobium minutum]|uniref:DUF6036 family nucleotidyltransferase n=1 Tax=Aurantimicrobium minutum TaxID=708131 RepID=UPI00247542EF|nr:DUF6036 family nucleotidyltransferase [Aurantimicrobium minutum]